MLVPVAFLALRACFLADIPADNLDHLHSGLSCSQIPVHSVTHLLAVAVAAVLLGHCVLKTRRNISFRCLSIHPRSLRTYCALSTLLTRCSRHRWQSSAATTTISSPLSAIPGLGQPCTPWFPGSIPTTPLRAASRQLRYHAEGKLPSKSLDLPGSASRT